MHRVRTSFSKAYLEKHAMNCARCAWLLPMRERQPSFIENKNKRVLMNLQEIPCCVCMPGMVPKLTPSMQH